MLSLRMSSSVGNTCESIGNGIKSSKDFNIPVCQELYNNDNFIHKADALPVTVSAEMMESRHLKGVDNTFTEAPSDSWRESRNLTTETPSASWRGEDYYNPYNPNPNLPICDEIFGNDKSIKESSGKP